MAARFSHRARITSRSAVLSCALVPTWISRSLGSLGSLTTYYLLLTTYYLGADLDQPIIRVINYLLLITYYLLLTTYYLGADLD